MNYLSPSEYEAFGLESTTPAAFVAAASAVMDAHCRRATLGMAQYQERLRCSPDQTALRLTYLPLAIVAPATTPILAARARYAMPRKDDAGTPLDAAWVFGLPGSWVDLDMSQIDFGVESGEVNLPINVLGLRFGELEITYTAGLASLPNPVKVACAQIVRNAQATPALNVHREGIDRMHLEYFADSLLDQTVRSLLAVYVAQKVG